MPDQPPPKSRRQWLRLSVRGLIVLVLLTGAGLGWLVRSARIQRDAVAAIRKSSGGILYDWEWKDGVYLARGEPFVPRWLVDRMGVDYFGHVVVVWLAQGGSVADLLHVGHLSQIEQLDLNGSFVTDAGLVHLRGLTNLSSLGLHSTQVTDAGLAHLERLTRLSSLYLGDTRVTDAGLVHLEGLTGLTFLNLGGTQVTDAGLAHLERLTGLTFLNLNLTQVTDAGLAHL